jgi:hypothetical protein
VGVKPRVARPHPERVDASSKLSPSVRVNGSATAELDGRPRHSTKVESPSEPLQDDSASPNLFQRLGFGFALLFIFLRFSFLHEFVFAKLGWNIHPIIILGSLSYLCTVLSGRFTSGFRSRITWMWLGFAFWMGLATATSWWRGASVPLYLAFLDSSLPVLFVLPAVLTNRQSARRVLDTIGIACMAMALLGALNKDFKAGRLNIDAVGSDIQDPNDYAAHVILMLPALVYLTFRPGRSLVMKALGVGFVALSLAQILSTGSRGGLTSLALTGIYVFAIAKGRVKAGLILAVPCLLLAALPFVPSESLERLGTIFSADAPQATEAVESSEQRFALLRESIRITFEHPLLGVGPGVFMDYQADQAKQTGASALWHVTHNSYTQVSSECGLPALICYSAALFLTFTCFRRTAKKEPSDLAEVAAVASVMLVGFCCCMLFLSMAYNVHLLILSALAVCLASPALQGSLPESTGMMEPVRASA